MVTKTFLQEVIAQPNVPVFIQEGMFEEAIKHIGIDNGLYLEFGTFTGETTKKIVPYIKDKILYGFDSFLGLEEDLTPMNHKGQCSLDGVPIYPDNVKLIVGRVQDTLVNFLEEHKEPLAFASFDMTYTPIKYSLDLLAKNKRLKEGSVISLIHAIRPENGKIYGQVHGAFLEVVKDYNLEFKYVALADVHLSVLITKDNNE